MNITTAITNRLPGGVKYDNVKKLSAHQKQFPSPLGKALLRLQWLQYCFGNRLGMQMGQDALFRAFDQMYLHGDVYTLPFIRLCKSDDMEIRSVIISECADLIFPYLSSPPILGDEGIYEQFGVAVEQNDVVFDCGANLGVFSLYAASKGAYVYAFEPLKAVFSLMQNNIKANPELQESIALNQLGCSDEKVTAELIVDSVSGGTLLKELSTNTNAPIELVALTPLDDFASEQGITKIDFIKADIEGAERAMLRGATRIMREMKPKLAICTYHLPDDKEVLFKIIKEANPAYEISFSSHKLFAR